MNIKEEFPNSGFFQSVFFFKYFESTGTCFFLNHDEKKYLISARHIFPDKVHKDSITIQINQNGNWFDYSGFLFFHKNPNIDIAVILPFDQELFNTPYNLLEIETPLGSEGYFFGFPYGIFSQDSGNINQGYPLPLIKRAISSGVIQQDGYHISILDGHNNPGFSGGPVIFKNRIKEHGDFEWRLDAVIAAYIPQSNKMKTKEEEIEYNENSGLIISYPKIYIKEIVENISK